MAIAHGARLGRYEIVCAIGSGGMGEVYRATDAALHRDVALKILPAALINDESRRLRFEQEARAMTAPHHPNIVTIHDFGTSDSLRRALRTCDLAQLRRQNDQWMHLVGASLAAVRHVRAAFWQRWEEPSRRSFCAKRREAIVTAGRYSAMWRVNAIGALAHAGVARHRAVICAKDRLQREVGAIFCVHSG